jgi:hypothetical protein
MGIFRRLATGDVFHSGGSAQCCSISKRLKMIPKVNWRAIFADIKSAKIRDKVVAFHCGTTEATIGNYRRGKCPGHQNGENILAFWAEHTGKDILNPPRQA